jgi:predicted Zn finger-like uncharacterized protein
VHTKCPDCKTRFRVNDDQLRVAQGQVRCSRCHIIFNALEHLHTATEDINGQSYAEGTATTTPDPVLDEFSELKAQIGDDPCPFEDSETIATGNESNTDMDNDLSDVLRELEEFELSRQRESEPSPPEEAAAPEEPTTTETPALETAVETAEVEQPEPPTSPRPDTARQEAQPGVHDQLLMEEILARSKPAKKTGGLWWSIGILFMLLLALSQLAWFGRVKLMHYPEGRALLQGACQTLGCELPTIRAPEQIQVLSRSITSHPRVENALLIQLTIANKANFSQPHPMLQISLFSSEEQLVVQRRFQPGEYLPTREQPGQLDPGRALYVELEIQDPGNDVTGFKLEFF